MKRLIMVSLVLALGTLGACSSPVAPTAGQAKHSQGKIGYSRYMLASGETPGPGCTDNGNGTQTCPAPTAQ
jgi:hypothetical protein